MLQSALVRQMCNILVFDEKPNEIEQPTGRKEESGVSSIPFSARIFFQVEDFHRRTFLAEEIHRRRDF